MERGYGAPSKTYPLVALRLPRIARNRGSLHLPYLEIKLTFECTARFYGLAPPLKVIEESFELAPKSVSGATTTNGQRKGVPNSWSSNSKAAGTETCQWEMLNFDPQTTHEPLKRSSPNLACVITSRIPSTKKNLGSIR